MRRPSLPPELADWVAIVIEDNAHDLLRYFRRRVNHPEEAADLLGQTLLTLWENGVKVPTTDMDARMWCFGVARNVLREHQRGVAKRIALANDLREHLTAVAVDNSADGAAEARMRATEIRGAVMSLDKKSRELVMLVHWDGFSIAAAARVMSMNASTARTRYARALRRLEAAMNDQPVRHDPVRPDAQPAPISRMP